VETPTDRYDFIKTTHPNTLMETIDISGSWQGEIIYGHKYRQYAGKALFFEATFTQQADDIHGTATDTGGEGVNPDLASITGRLAGNRFSFIKRYASLAYIDEEGKRVVDRSTPGFDIHYLGIYDTETGKFSGTWEYRVKMRVLWIIPWLHRPGGTWTMSRK
jgi:hypothetical protein